MIRVALRGLAGRKLRAFLTALAVFLGVSLTKQAEYVASASRRVQMASSVDMLIFFLVRDDASAEGWQSGLTTVRGVKKPAYTAFRLPLVRTSRSGDDPVRAGSPTGSASIAVARGSGSAARARRTLAACCR